MIVLALLSAELAGAQGLTGTLIGTVRDDQGGVLTGAVVSVRSPALIGGSATVTTNDKGQLRFPLLAPGAYALEVRLDGFAEFTEEHIILSAGATVERTVTLRVAGRAESIVVEGRGSRVDARDPGLGKHFGLSDLETIPTRRSSMFDAIRATPGMSPTSPSSGSINTVSAFGSGTNENQFLIDGTNFTCPCNGVARAEPGVDFIQEIHLQSTGASAEFGNVQGAVINVILKQGSDRFLLGANYSAQMNALTSQPVRLPVAGSSLDSAYHRARYSDLTSSLGGPIARSRLWFFVGYQYLRDDDSQPGTVPELPRRTAQDTIFEKLTWQLAPDWQFVHSLHDQFQDSHEQPTIVLPFITTLHRRGSVPATTFGNLTHASRSNTMWDLRVGRFTYLQEGTPSAANASGPNRLDSLTGVSSGAPASLVTLRIRRTTAKATASRYLPGLLGADHELKVGGQLEEAGHRSTTVIPTNARFIDRGEQRSQRISAAPASVGGQFVTVSGFGSDVLTLGHRFTISAGLRFDHNRAISQDVPAVDSSGSETDAVVAGLGTLYSWNRWSPRIGLTTKLRADGRTMLRASYGRFIQGVMTGELEPFHPGGTTTTTSAFDTATGDYTTTVSIVNPRDLRLDPTVRAPRTDEYSIGVDREVTPRLAVAIAYVRKAGTDFIGWTDIGGKYAEAPVVLKDGRTASVFTLLNKPSDRRFLLTNPDEYSLAYNGLVTAVERRRANGWQASASYTYSKTYGLVPSSGTTAAGAQVSTVSPPQPLTFGRDPNDLINALGRLPNDRPHVFRLTGSADVPRTTVVVAGSLQYFSGKPWAATALINPQNSQQRVLLEPRGTRRLSSQTLLDVRVSRTFHIAGLGRSELMLDVLNALNDTAEESIVADDLFNPSTFDRPSTFIDPRRAMISVRINLGR